MQWHGAQPTGATLGIFPTQLKQHDFAVKVEKAFNEAARAQARVEKTACGSKTRSRTEVEGRLVQGAHDGVGPT